MKTIDEMIAVMRAAKEGAQIELSPSNSIRWFRCQPPLWDWATHDYRVKPKRKRVPRTMDDLPKGGALWIRDKNNYMIAISTVDNHGICWPKKYANPDSELSYGVELFASESDIEISADRVTWLPWWKEVEE